jgi:hypothetical protein
MSLTDYIPTLPEGSFDIPDDIYEDISQATMILAQESSDIYNEFLGFETDLGILQKMETNNVSFEASPGESNIGVHIGTGPLLGRVLGGKKDPVTGKQGLDIRVEPKITVGELFMRKVRELAKRVWTAIKNFFISIFHFFQSKIVQTDKMLSSTNFSLITGYYENRNKVMVKVLKYNVDDVGKEFLKDSKILQNSIPALRDAILSVISSVENPIGDLVRQENQDHIARSVEETGKIIQDIYKGILPLNLNIDLVNEINITKLIRQKYFGNAKKSVEQDIRTVISDASLYEYIISDEAFKSFRSMYRENEKTIQEATRKVDKFKQVLENIEVSSTFYMDLQTNMGIYRRLLTTMLFTCTSYWELYFTIYSDIIRCAKAIIDAGKK